jgi:hypothetical protein
MRKAPVMLTLAIVAGIGAYFLWAYPRLPAEVPMKWDMANRPVAFGSREAFVGIPAVITVFLAALSLAATWWQPKAAWVAPLAVGVMLFFVHVSVQAVLRAFLPIPVNVAVAAVLAGVVVASAVAVLAQRRKSAASA